MPDAARYYRRSSAPARPTPYRLTFILPRELGPIAPGRHQPTDDGPVITIDLVGLVHVTGRSRGEIFDHAARFLRNVSRGKRPCTLIATCVWPPGTFARGAHEDHWIFAIGADVSWAPTPLGAEIAPAR